MSGRQLASRAALLMMLAGQGLDFLRTVRISGGSPAFTFTSDDVGAFCVVLAQSSTLVPSISVSAGGWTTTDPGIWGTFERRLFSKVITAGDVTSGLTLAQVSALPGGDGASIAWIGKGPASLSVLSNTASAGGASTLTIPAHSMAANSLGVIAFVTDSDNPVTGIDTFLPPTAPPSVTRQAAVIDGGAAYGLYEWAGADDTGQALTFTGFDTTSTQAGVLVELLS